MISAALATEDVLSQSVGQRLFASHKLHPSMLLQRNGRGYLFSRMKNWCEMAAGSQPIVLITDLDKVSCAPALVSQWFGRYHRSENIVLRVAVREIESWLLADHEGMQRLLGTAKKIRFPADPDTLPDPKRHLLHLASNARREIRDELVAVRGATASQGIGYNARLCTFVSTDWDPDRASARSDSLRRARARIAQLASRLAT